jgi:hypothetical protein
MKDVKSSIVAQVCHEQELAICKMKKMNSLKKKKTD